MNVQLTKRWVDVLRSQPEHGMGYQIVDFTLESGACVRGVVVLNAELAKWPDDAVAFDPDRIQTVKASQPEDTSGEAGPKETAAGATVEPPAMALRRIPRRHRRDP